MRNLENSPLDPDTRAIIWGSPANYERWVNIAKMMERFDTKNINAKAGIGSFAMVSKQMMGAGLAVSGAYDISQGDTDFGSLAKAIGGTTLLISPIVLTRYINDPKKYRALMLGLQQTPPNFFRSRIAVNLAADSAKELAQEGEQRYPVLPGESR